MTVGVSKLVSLEDEVEQISLFDTENEKRSRQDKLEQVVDDLRKKHGLDAIRLGSQENREIGVTRSEDCPVGISRLWKKYSMAGSYSGSRMTARL